MLRPTEAKHDALNINPNWRAIGLGFIKMHRSYLCNHPHSIDMRAILKKAQLSMVKNRQRLAAFDATV